MSARARMDSRSAGFTGMEKGRRFPESAAEMLPVLKKAQIQNAPGSFLSTAVPRTERKNEHTSGTNRDFNLSLEQ